MAALRLTMAPGMAALRLTMAPGTAALRFPMYIGMLPVAIRLNGLPR